MKLLKGKRMEPVIARCSFSRRDRNGRFDERRESSAVEPAKVPWCIWHPCWSTSVWVGGERSVEGRVSFVSSEAFGACYSFRLHTSIWTEEQPPLRGIAKTHDSVVDLQSTRRWRRLASARSAFSQSFGGETHPLCVRDVDEMVSFVPSCNTDQGV